MLTRAEYWIRHKALVAASEKCDDAGHAALHHEYYMQFVTDSTRRVVISHIGKSRILASTDPHFNDIPLAEWDRLESLIKSTIPKRILGEAEGCKPGWYNWSLGTAVCVAKAVAHEMRAAAEMERAS